MSHFLYKFHMFLEQYWKELETFFVSESIEIERLVQDVCL